MTFMLDKVKEIISNSSEDEILYKKWDTAHRSDYFSKVYWHYHPATEKYFFEGNPSFSHEYKNMFDCGRFPIIMLRDGYVGVLEFFILHPKPPRDFRSIVAINKKFTSLVPEKWKGYVVSYSVKQREDTRVKDSSELLVVYGFGTEDIFWKQSAEELIAEVANVSKGFKETVCIFPQRESMLSSGKEQVKNHALELIKRTYQHFGFDVKLAMNFRGFFNNNQVEEFSFLGLDKNKAFISDNYFEHYMYSKGGRSLNEQEQVCSDNIEYNLSRFHKISFEDIDYSKCIFPEFYIQYKLLGGKDVSMYKIYQSEVFKKLFLKYFT